MKGEGSQATNSNSPRAGRPTPVFSNVKHEDEELSGTIPWAVPVTPKCDKGEDRKKVATASHHHHVVEVAHHHHHLHLQPAPPAHILMPPPCLVSPAPQMYVDDCSHFFPDERRCQVNANAAGDRARASREGEPAASSAPGRRQVDLEEDLYLSDSDEEEKKFHSGMRRMVTRAELHRAQHRRRHL